MSVFSSRLMAMHPLITSLILLLLLLILLIQILLSMSDERLSTHFTLNEMVRSTIARMHGFDNHPTPAIKENLRKLCVNVLEPLRELAGRPLTITSGYRCDKLNSCVKGVRNSQHRFGLAADIRLLNKADMRKLFRCAQQIEAVDQCIIEHNKTSTWLHISTSDNPRHQFFTQYL